MRRAATVLTAAVAMAALAGCGGGGGSSKSSAAAGGSASNTLATTGPAASSSGGGGGGRKFCTDAVNNNLASQLAANAASPASGTDALQKNLQILKSYVSEAPSEIRADLTTLINFYEKYTQILINDKSDPSKLATDMPPIEAQAAGLATASQHLGAYYTAHCHP